MKNLKCRFYDFLGFSSLNYLSVGVRQRQHLVVNVTQKSHLVSSHLFPIKKLFRHKI